MNVKTKILENGATLIAVQIPGSELVSSNVIIKAGGRYENKETYGLSHFLEHVAFKGTKSFPNSTKFIEVIEDLGGIVNAWTSEEATCYWNILPKEHIEIALKVLSEQVSELILDQKEIDKERGPIIEEIKRAHDDPYSFVWHNIYEVMWPEQPISGGVLGPVKNIEKFQREDFISYLDKRYIGDNINVCIASSLDSDEVFKLVENYFRNIKSGTTTPPKPIEHRQSKPNFSLVERDIKQGHILFGYKTFGINDERVPALKVLMNVLSTGMSSILFKEVREKRGAAYAIQGDQDYFSDAGAAYIYAGLNTKKTEEVIRTIKEILKGLIDKPLSDDQIEKAKEFIKGITLYQLDGVERIAFWHTTKGLLDTEHLDPKKYLTEINKVTAADVQAVAKDVFKPENESLLILGPFKDKEKFAKILAE